VNYKARQYLWSELVKLEFEGGDDSEIAAAAAERPEQIRVFFRGRMHQVAVRRDHVGRKKIVDGQAEFARNPAEATAERQPGDAGGRIDACGYGEPKSLCLLVEVGEHRAGLDPRSLPRRIDPHRLHLRQVDHDTAIADRAAGDVVTTAPDRDQ
jgi:hypothetical protein